MKDKIIIGSRKSKLAIKQVEIVIEMIKEKYPDLIIEHHTITSLGDQRLDLNYKNSDVSLKGLFTSDLEKALINKEIDLAIHSLKDVSTSFDNSLELIGYLNEEDNCDVLVSNKYQSIKEMPSNSIIGTSSKRRELQIKQIRDDLKIIPIRGNINTRLNKLDNNEYDAIVLAYAGLKRLNLEHRIVEYFNPLDFLPASGQGILAIQARKDDHYLKDIINQITNPNTQIKAKMQRIFSTIFDGGCTTPMGCHAYIEDDYIYFKGMYYYNDIHYISSVEGKLDQYVALAYQLANKIKAQYSKPGIVSLVGAGPGEIELLSIKAMRLIKEADCILYDRLINNEILEYAREDAKLIYVGKDNKSLGNTQELINQQIINAAYDYQNVVRLKSGDPFVYGRGYEEVLVLKQYQIKYNIVCGISSFIAASSSSEIPLTDRNNSSSIHIFSGHNKNNIDNLKYEEMAKLDGTLIFMMAVANFKKIATNLVKHNFDKKIKVAFIENVSSNEERMIISSLEQVIDSDISLKIKNPAIIIVGKTVGLHDKSMWQHNKKICLLSTRELKHYEEFKQKCLEYQFDCSLSSQIRIIDSIDKNKIDLNEYDIVLFNSINGFEYFLKDFELSLLKDKLIGCVGSKTRSLIENNNLNVQILAQEYTMKDLLNETLKLYPNKKVLIIGSKKTSLDLKEYQKTNNQLTFYPAYDVEYIKHDYLKLQKQLDKSHVICFFSASGVDAFMNNINFQNDLIHRKKIASIGPVTTKRLLEYGIEVDIQASTYTQENLIRKIKEYYDV